jgi:tRNA (adenine22-N1)-methyltransferase
MSRRLETIAKHVIPGLPMADIGTDHAYVPCALLRARIVPHAIASDVRAGPLAHARTHIERAGMQQSIAVRLGDGLSVLSPGEVGTVTICGMGGQTIASMLSPHTLRGVSRLIVQPQGAAHRVRAAIYESGWMLRSEQVVRDAGCDYVVLTADPGGAWWPCDAHGTPLDKDVVYTIGPLCLWVPTPDALAYARTIVQKKIDMIARIGDADREKSTALRTHIVALEHALEQCAQGMIRTMPMQGGRS